MMDHKDFLIGLEDLKNMRAAKRKLEDELSSINEDIHFLVSDLVEYMDETNQLSVKVGGLGTCSMTSSKKYSIEDPTAFESWMREKGELDLVMAVHPMKVHGYYKECLENNQELPPGVRTFIKNNIVIRGN